MALSATPSKMNLLPLIVVVAVTSRLVVGHMNTSLPLSEESGRMPVTV